MSDDLESAAAEEAKAALEAQYQAERDRTKAIHAAARQLGTPSDLRMMALVHGLDVATATEKFEEFKATGHCRIKSSEWGERPPQEPVEPTEEFDE